MKIIRYKNELYGQGCKNVNPLNKGFTDVHILRTH